jgi:hypothetical protein
MQAGTRLIFQSIFTIARNSLSSKMTYSSAINHFQNFFSQDQYREKYQGCNCETILQPLLENKINVYELFDHFVSFLVATKPDLTPKSVRLYITTLRSYFAYHIDVIPSKFKRRVKTPNSTDKTKNHLMLAIFEKFF